MELVSNDLFFNAPDLTQDTQQNQGLSKIGQIKQRMANFNMQNQGAISQSAPSLNANQNTAQDEAYIQNLYQHAQEIAKQPLSAQEMQEAQNWKPEHIQSDPKQQRQIMRQGVFDEITGALKPIGDTIGKVFTIATNQINPVTKFDNNVLNLFRDEDEKKQVQNKSAITHETERIYGKMLEDMTHTDTPEQRQALENFVFNLGDKQGYDVFVDTIKGKERFIFKDRKTGKEMDVTPNMWDNIKASSNQITGEVLGALMPGGLAARMVKSGLGGAALGQADLNQQEAYTGQDLNLQDRLKKSAYMFGEGAAGELVGEAALRTLYAPFKAYQSAKQGIQKAGQMGQEALDTAKSSVLDNALSNTPVVNHIRSTNIKGAQDYADNVFKNLSKDELNKLDESLSSISPEVLKQNQTLQNLSDWLNYFKSKNPDSFASQTATKIQSGIDNISSKLGSLNLSKQEQELLSKTRASNELSSIVAPELMKNQKAMSNYEQLLNMDADLILKLAKPAENSAKVIKEIIGDKTLRQTGVKGSYETRISQEFENMKKQIQNLNQNQKIAFDEADIQGLKQTLGEKFVYNSPTRNAIDKELDALLNKQMSVNEAFEYISKLNKRLKGASITAEEKDALREMKLLMQESLASKTKNPNQALKLIKEANEAYRSLKLFQKTSDTYAKSGTPEEVVKALVKEKQLDNAHYKTITKGMSKKELESLDSAVMDYLITSNIKDIGTGSKTLKFFDNSNFVKQITPLEFQTKAQNALKESLVEFSRLRAGDMNLIRALGTLKKDAAGTNGLSHDFVQKALTFLANMSFRRIVRLLPTDWGKQEALIYHTLNALKSAKTNGDLYEKFIASKPKLDKQGLKIYESMAQEFQKESKEAINLAKAIFKGAKNEQSRVFARNLFKEYEKPSVIYGKGFVMSKPEINKDFKFIGKNNKEYTLSKEAHKEWLKSFNLKSLDDDFIPKIPNEVKNIIGKDIKLTKGSLLKLVEKNRTQYIKEIRATFESPDFVIKHNGSFIFARKMNDKLYFSSVAKDFNVDIIAISNAPKKRSAIANKLKDGKVIYQKPSNFGVLRYNKLLQAGGLQPTGLNDTLPEKSLNLPEAPKEKDLRQKLDDFMSEQKAEQKLKDDRIKDLKDKVMNLNKNNKAFKVSNDEAKELYAHFKFKGNKPLIREIRQDEINHALKSHAGEAKESARGNIAINEKEIYENYPKITQDYTDKFFTDKGVIYVKQINGYFIAIEEVLSGKDKIIFKTAWKTKGQYNKEILLRKVKATSNP